MALSIGLSVSPQDPQWLELAREAERVGADSIWVPEFWAYDALTPLAAIAARTERIRLASGIAQLGARTPAMLAMSAMSLQNISGGRFILGIGASGPQVMEGWHGVGFSPPVRRTRETIEIIRMITAGERLTYSGEVYQLPLPGGEGVAIRSRAAPCFVPVYVAALGPANLALTGELADGWIGNSFFPESSEVFLGPIAAAARRAGRPPSDLDLVVAVSVEFTDDVEAAGRRHAAGYAFTFGAMGSKASNFYNNAFARQGFGDDVAEVQRLWAEGDREAAAARVPIGIGLGTNLIGPPDVIRGRLRAYRDCGVTTLRVNPIGRDFHECITGLGTLIDLVNDVNGEAEQRGHGQL
jgi:F420-dependent oxidoreductase-like protein